MESAFTVVDVDPWRLHSDPILVYLPPAEHQQSLPERMLGPDYVHKAIEVSVLWEHLEQLKDAGASSILVLPVEKMLL